MPARVLVTGATGFVGQTLVGRLLGGGREVRVLVRDRDRARALWADRVEVFEGDLTRSVEGCAAGIEAVFHLAGHAHAEDEGSGRSDELHRAITVGGTRRLLADAVRHGAPRFLFMSSVKAIGEGTHGTTPDRGDRPHPTTAYGRAKLEAEGLVLAAPLEGTALRSPLVYGPSVKGNLQRMLAAIGRRRFPPLPAVDQRRSMVDVRDVAAALEHLEGDRRSAGAALIVTDGEIYTTRRLYEAMARASGVAVPPVSVPYALLALGARVGDLGERLTRRKLPLNSDRLDKLFGSAHYDPSALFALGFRPRFTLETALPEMVQALHAGAS